MQNRKNYTDEEWEKLCRDNAKYSLRIIQALWDMGYEDVYSDQNALNVIRTNHIDISGFNLPYGCETLDEWQTEIDRIQTVIDSGKMTAEDLKRPDVAI